MCSSLQKWDRDKGLVSAIDFHLSNACGKTNKQYVLHLADPKRDTGGPPLTQKSLTWFPLTRFLVYVRASGRFSGSRGL